ncbi:MAG: division plane positioning ATPase MipZ [Cyanobacteria bacterium P01_A01_bin.17]
METAARTNEELFDADSQGDRPTSSLLVVNPLKAQAEILSSDNLLQKVLERDPELEKISDVHKYRNFFDVDLIENSNVFSISAKGLTPEVVLQRAQIVTQTYQEHLSDLRSADVASRQAFYQADLKRASRDLSDAEHELARYRKAAGLVDTQRQAEAIISLISDLKKIQELALLEANRDASQSQVLSSRLNLLTQATAPVSGSYPAEDTEYQLILQELTVVTTELREKRTELTESHPYIKALLSKRDNLQQQLEQYKVQAFAQNAAAPLTGIGVEGQKEIAEQIALVENSASSKRKQAQNIELRINLLEANLRSLPRQQSRLDTLKRRLNVSKRTFNELISQVERSRADALQSYPNVQLLNTPILNPTPTSNRLWIAIHSLFAAGFGSLVLLLMLERRNPLLMPQDLAETSFPVATRIPKLQQFRGVDKTLLPLSGGEAAFLKMAYGLLIQEIPDRCLMVTSAISGEGKTTIALHLAKALEALGLKVLVLHTDTPADTPASVESEAVPLLLESRFSHTDRPWASSRLRIDETQPEGMQVGHLEFSGRSEFEAEVEKILDSQRYDFVIFDTPPVQSGSTATLISMVVDNVLLVVRPGKSTRFSVQDTLQLLAPAHLNLVGLAINDPGYFGLSNRKGWEENFAISNANVAPVKVAA